MNWLLVFVLIGVCIWLILAGLSRRGKFYEYPFLAGTTFVGFVVPQLPAYVADPFIPANAFAKMVFFTILCAAMCAFGWSAAKRPLRMNWNFDERRLVWVSVLLSLLGAFFYYKISRLPPELLSVEQWTGLPVAYLFFARVMTYGFAVAALCFARRPSKLALGVILFDAVFYMDRIVMAGRRMDTEEFLMVSALAAWFGRALTPPRPVALAGVVVFSLAIASTGEYRSKMHNDTGSAEWSDIANIGLIRNFEDLIENGGIEVHNAILQMHYVDRSRDFDYGIFHWNQFVFAFIPAQLFGKEFKESLYADWFPGQLDREYVTIIGSTPTGMTDAFASFWYFGAAKFFLIAYLLGRIYRTAAAGSYLFQLVYMLSVTPAMLAITHHTQWLFSFWVHMLLLLFPFLLLGRKTLSRPRLAPSPAGETSRYTRASAEGTIWRRTPPWRGENLAAKEEGT